MSATIVPLTEEIFVGGEAPCFVIAEIGQNHQGDLNIAKRLICAAKKCGADCVKFQKSTLKEKFTNSALARPYSSSHSWGETYGQHKQYLELSVDQFKELQNYAKEVGILFSASGMDPISIDILDSLAVPFIKIGSGDADNLLLIRRAARLQKPLFISTGMQDLRSVRMIYDTVTKLHKKLVLLHCVSAYPTPNEDVNLRVIQAYQHMFPVPIGYSGHETGIAISVAAVALGAKVIERHITLNKQWKGSDHICSLEPEEFKQMVCNIRHVELALGSPVKRFLPCEKLCQEKLGKSIVAAEDLSKGTQLTENNIRVKVSEPSGVSCSHVDSILGNYLTNSINKDVPILFTDISKSKL